METLENIKATLERHGTALDKVIKCTIFLPDTAEWSSMNKIYSSYFKKSYPARSAVAVGALALGARGEIECMAFIR